MCVQKLEEYKLIREEILQALETVRNYKNLLYATTAAILAFAFTQSNPFIFLIPYVVIIPICIMDRNQRSSLLRLGAYLQVFCEEDLEIKWETNLKKYDETYRTKIKKPEVNQYVLNSICCSLLAFIHLDFSNFLSANTILSLLIILIVTIFSICIIRNNQIDYYVEKKEYIQRWIYIKEER